MKYNKLLYLLEHWYYSGAATATTEEKSSGGADGNRAEVSWRA